MATVVVITSAAFAPNPVSLGSATKLSVSVMEITQTPVAVDIISAEFYSGEV